MISASSAMIVNSDQTQELVELEYVGAIDCELPIFSDNRKKAIIPMVLGLEFHCIAECGDKDGIFESVYTTENGRMINQTVFL